ncbi:hypothetical protein [Streptomyces sp. NPDC001282]|uniref:hypothetical protein n=1 Tax=Streptomyces sp. NPDC001282 TaxID=3364557 RepID=UPI0036B37AB6
MTAFIVMFHGAPTTAAPDLATAQAHALAERTAPAGAEPYENRWDEHAPGEWRLMTRRRDRGGRWSWTQRAIQAVPLIHGEQPAPADRAAVLREAATFLEAHASTLELLSSSEYDNEAFAASHLRAKAADFRRMADEAQQAASAVTEEPADSVSSDTLARMLHGADVEADSDFPTWWQLHPDGRAGYAIAADHLLAQLHITIRGSDSPAVDKARRALAVTEEPGR